MKMTNAVPPPPALEGARLLAYAVVDETVVHTGNSTLYVDGKLMGAVPYLAICQQETEAVLLLFCDEKWNSLGVVECSSLVEAQRRAEREYKGLSTKWVSANVSEEEAARYLDEQSGTQRCSFCGKSPNEVRQMFGVSTACICDGCIRDFHQALDATP
jgi:ClpX C4-type zinc finger